MTILKTILAGVLAGTAIFLMPFFLLKFLAIVILFKAAFRLLGMGRQHKWRERFKNMTEEERTAFMQKFKHGRCGHYYNAHQTAQPTA